jgi:hypothetical protein
VQIKFWRKSHWPWLKLLDAAWRSESVKFFQEDLKQQNSLSIEEFNGGTISSLILLLFLLVSTFWGPFFNMRKKPCQLCVAALEWSSESEELALEEVVSDPMLLEQSSRDPLGEDSHMLSSASIELKSVWYI